MSENVIPAAKVRKAVAAYTGGAKLGDVAKILSLAPEKAERVLWRSEPLYAEGAKVAGPEFDLSTADGRKAAASVVYSLREGLALPAGYTGGRIASDARSLRYERIAARTGLGVGAVKDLYAVARDGFREDEDRAGKPRPEAESFKGDSYTGRGRRFDTTRDIRAIREAEDAKAETGTE